MFQITVPEFWRALRPPIIILLAITLGCLFMEWGALTFNTLFTFAVAADLYARVFKLENNKNVRS